MSSVKQYRKKPVVVEAMIFKGSNAREIAFWASKNTPDSEFKRIMAMSETGQLRIITLEGEMEVSEGDYVIKGVKGEFYPCKPDIFEATYEAVDSDKQTKHRANTKPKSELANHE